MKCTVQRHRLSKGLRPNHGTIECFRSPRPHCYITELPQFIMVHYVWLSRKKLQSDGSKTAVQETLEIHPPTKINGKTAIHNRNSSGRTHTPLKKLQQHTRTENWTLTTQKEEEDHACTFYPMYHPSTHCSAPYCSALRGNSPANKSPPC